jgi:hypothetical protein
VKWLVWLLAFFVLATAIKEGSEYFGPMAQAFRAYRVEAEHSARSSRNDPRFRDIEGHIIHVGYQLESAERIDDGGVRLVVVEAVHFQRVSESGPFGNRRIAKTRQHVVMTRTGSDWTASRVEEEPTEVNELSAIDLEN